MNAPWSRAGFVDEHDGFLDPATAARIYALCRAAPIASSLFYLACDALDPGALACYLPEALAAFVVPYLRRLLALAPAAMRRHAHGFELWTTHAERSASANLYLHIDSDEALRTRSGTLRTPMLGSVLYLGPAHGLVGGETLFLPGTPGAGRFAPFAFHECAALTAAAGARTVRPTAGKLVTFAGDLPHGQMPVTDHPDGLPRIALLANLWDARIGCVPDGLCALSPDAFRASRSG